MATTRVSTTAATVALTGSDQAASAVPAVYRGFSVRETAGAVAVVRIYDHASAASGTLLDTISLAASESRAEYYAQGIWAVNGIYVKIVSGTIEGSVRTG